MGGEWITCSLGDLFKVKHGFAFKGEYFTEEPTDSLLVTPGNFAIGGGFQNLKPKYYNGPIPDGYILSPGQIVVTMTDLSKQSDTLGLAATIPDDEFTWLHNQRIGLLEFKNDIPADPRFISYFLRMHSYRSWVIGSASGTTVKHTSPGRIESFECNIPPLEEQKPIAHILGTLDDKIELNRQMNTTLEAMAQALFKSWFVDFDPVIDNALAAGNPIPEPLQARAEARMALGDKRKPLPEAIQQQFPSSFVLCEEMGWVPEGWESRAIGEIFNLLGGHPFKSSEYVEDGKYGIVTIKNVQDASFVEECSNRLSNIPAKMKEHCYLSAGDILLSLTGNVGRVCIVSPGEYLLNQRVAKLVKNKCHNNAFAYFYFRQRSVYEEMLTIAKGTAQQNLSPIETAKILQVMPSDNSIAILQQQLEIPFNKIVSNTAQIQSLTKVRDTLLPKLLSGQLRIPDAEAMVEQVAAG